MNPRRTHVVIPENLVRAIDALVGRRRRSAFIAEAAQREVERRELLVALETAAASWKDKNHPELKRGAAAWIAGRRRADNKRDEERRGRFSR
jgi:hypothetical protein